MDPIELDSPTRVQKTLLPLHPSLVSEYKGGVIFVIPFSAPRSQANCHGGDIHAAEAQLICRTDLTGGGVAPPPAFGSGEGEAAMACVYIPVQNSEEEVRVQLDQLPRDASDILDILKAEQAPLDLWLIIAVRFLVSDFAFRICQFL